MVFEDGDCRDKPQIWGFQILSQHRFNNNGDQAPRNKAMSNHFFDTSEDDTDDIDADYSNNDDPTTSGGDDIVIS